MKKDSSPATREVYINVARFLRLHRITQDKFRIELNKHLPDDRKVPANHVGAVTISRWLSTTANKWNEPQSEITEAAKQALKELKKQYK